MQARQLPAHRGFAWLREGLQLWRRNPALLTFASFGYLLMLVVISVVPVIGQPIASLLMPVFSLGVLNTCRAIDERRKAGPDILFSGFQKNLPTLVTIGGLYLLGSLLALLLTSLADGGTLLQMMAGGGQIDPEAAERPGFTFALVIALLTSTPVMMAYWFAPVLAGWWNVPAPKAMFFSFVTCLRNWRPFLVYAMALAVFGVLMPTVVIGAIGLVSPTLAGLLTIPLPLLIIPVVFASFYINARDVFVAPDDEQAPAER